MFWREALALQSRVEMLKEAFPVRCFVRGSRSFAVGWGGGERLAESCLFQHNVYLIFKHACLTISNALLKETYEILTCIFFILNAVHNHMGGGCVRVCLFCWSTDELPVLQRPCAGASVDVPRHHGSDARVQGRSGEGYSSEHHQPRSEQDAIWGAKLS